MRMVIVCKSINNTLLTLNWGIFFTLIVSSFSLPSAIRISCLWPTSKVGHWFTWLIVFPERCWLDAAAAVKVLSLWLLAVIGGWTAVVALPPPLISWTNVLSCLLPEGPVFSHLDVLKRQIFSFRHQLQPQFVVKQSLQLFIHLFIQL